LASGDRRYVIIGNGAAGTTCAETLRKQDPNCRITLLTNEPHPLYNRVALPRYLKGVVREEKVFMRTREQHAERGIELLTEVTARRVDAEGRTVLLDDGRELPYDALLVASGGRPNRPQIPGGDSSLVFNFQTMDDTRAIIAEATSGKRAVVIGGSFISYELAEGFAMRGLHTTWMMRNRPFLRRTLDSQGGAIVEALAHEHGVEFVYGEEAAEILPKNGLAGRVVTNAGRELDADVVGVGLGLTLNTECLEGTGVEVRRGIVTDERLRTRVPGIYAAGDVAEFYDVHIQGHNRMGTWDNALSHGKTAAVNMAGGDEVYHEVPTYTSTMFSSNIAVMGVTRESRPDLESVTRADLPGREYKQLFFLGDRLVGAVTIGRPKGRKRMLALMLSGEPIEGPREALLDLK
jgi:NAD(P)H-nitrite reductase large subunit